MPLEEKTYVKIGTAVIDRSRCIAWEQDKACLICDEACPYNAINNLNVTIQNITIGRPFVDEKLCTGCGICEAKCPIEGRSAIEIYLLIFPPLMEIVIKWSDTIYRAEKLLKFCKIFSAINGTAARTSESIKGETFV